MFLYLIFGFLRDFRGYSVILSDENHFQPTLWFFRVLTHCAMPCQSQISDLVCVSGVHIRIAQVHPRFSENNPITLF